jgi:hypothetical protein
MESQRRKAARLPRKTADPQQSARKSAMVQWVVRMRTSIDDDTLRRLKKRTNLKS